MRTTTVTVGPLASASANNIAQSQTPSGSGDLTLDGSTVSGGIATLDTARRVIVTSSGNDTSRTFTIYGTDWNGNAVSETVTGANATAAQSLYDFKTVTRVAVDGATAGTVTVGTNGVASSRPIFLDTYGLAPTSLQVAVSGTVSYTVQQTLSTGSYPTLIWVNHPDSNLVVAGSTAQGNYAYLPVAVRLTLNSGSGSATLSLLQSGSHVV